MHASAEFQPDQLHRTTSVSKITPRHTRCSDQTCGNDMRPQSSDYTDAAGSVTQGYDCLSSHRIPQELDLQSYWELFHHLSPKIRRQARFCTRNPPEPRPAVDSAVGWRAEVMKPLTSMRCKRKAATLGSCSPYTSRLLGAGLAASLSAWSIRSARMQFVHSLQVSSSS